MIRAELLLDEGDPFTTLNLNKSISKLKARRIFRSVEPEVLTGSKENLKLINIKVQEMPTGEIVLVLVSELMAEALRQVFLKIIG